jgi:1-acyl-sn-glycerol-3-phosphate acyltransferase
MADVVEPTERGGVLVSPEAARAALRACGLAITVTRLIWGARADQDPLPTAYPPRAQRTAKVILAGHGVEVRTHGRPPEGPAVLVANHVSYMDPLVVSAAAPCISIAKGETADWPLIGKGLRALGVLFVRRGDAHSGAVTLRRALRALGGGATVLNFPEGTTSDGRQVGEFRRGIFGLAALAGVPVVPTRIVYSDDGAHWYGGQTFLPHYWRLAGVHRLIARVFFGDPLSVRDADADTDQRTDGASQLAARARAAVESLGAL